MNEPPTISVGWRCRDCGAPATVLLTSPVPISAVCDAHAPEPGVRPAWEAIAARYRMALQAIVDQRCTLNNCACGWCPGHCTAFWQIAYDALGSE